MIFNRGRHGVQFFVDRFSLFHPRVFLPLPPSTSYEWDEKFAKNSPSPRIVLMNSTRSLPRSILGLFFLFFTSFQRFLSPPGPPRLSNISVDKLSQLIRGGSRAVPRRSAPINGLSLPTNRGKFSLRGTQSIGYNHSG